MKIFNENPSLDEIYQTSDGNQFMTRNAAENHAKTLQAKTVKRIVRPDAKNVAVVDVDAPNVIGLNTFQTGVDEEGNPNLKQAVIVVDENGKGKLDSVDVEAPKVDADLTEKPLPEVTKTTDVVEVSVKTDAGTTNLMPQNVNSAVVDAAKDAEPTKATVKQAAKPVAKPTAKETKTDSK